MSTDARLVDNPYNKTASAAVFNLPHNEGMGRQSQQRVSNTKRQLVPSEDDSSIIFLLGLRRMAYNSFPIVSQYFLRAFLW
jgi:hypothetical protein